MGLFSFFRKKPLFNASENEVIVSAIRSAEQNTSGEVRVFVESRNYLVNPLERAAEVFLQLKMQDTEHRNAVLLYIAIKDKELALFADEGIFKAVGADYWNHAVKQMISEFSKDNVAEGIAQCVIKVGNTLKEKFPYDRNTDKNELPDEIVFGK